MLFFLANMSHKCDWQKEDYMKVLKDPDQVLQIMNRKLKETHIRREPLDIAAKVLHQAARFTLVAQRRNENPSILLAQDTGVWVSKDSIEVEAVSLDTQPAD